jgi:hypothetical protein
LGSGGPQGVLDVPNLGCSTASTYETGRVERRWFVGLGRRSVAYDRARRRVYFTDFLRGEILAFDERSEQITDRWFVGHFSRWSSSPATAARC